MINDPDIAHRREYERLREEHTQLPEWTALTEEQRQNVRKANAKKWDFFKNLGDAIRTGGPLPKPEM